MHPLTVRAETYMTEGRRPSAVEEAGALRATIGRRMSPWTLTLIVLVVGALVTVTCAWTARTLNRNNEHRLLVLQTTQAANVLALTIVQIENPLLTGVELAAGTGGDVERFTRYMSAYTGPTRQFVSVSLWHATGGSVQEVTSIGSPPELAAGSAASAQLADDAIRSGKVEIRGLSTQRLERVAYAVADSQDRSYVVYAERAIPDNRRVPVESNSAFADLNYATYVGPKAGAATLATTDLPLDALPLTGDVVQDAIPFGSSTLILVASPRGQLGGSLGSDLPWMFVIGGLLLTIGAAIVTNLISRRQRKAEEDAVTISGLYDRLDSLFDEQRSISESLQKALLPQRNPELPNLEIASRYVAGARSVDVGGDWYSVIRVDSDRFAFVVGDVSGRGISAASVMARLRFTMRAYLLEGHAPADVLEMCSRQFNIAHDHHLATALVGLGNLRTRQITLSNAGHLNPLIIASGRAEFVPTSVGLPLGVADSTYRSVTLTMPEASTLVAYTDGLVERRGEILDVGLERLAHAATASTPDLDDLVASLVTGVTGPDSDDDIALLALRWTTEATVARPVAPPVPAGRTPTSETT
jgi:serine phosphatase RsbU (regulator of sigma subunit)